MKTAAKPFKTLGKRVFSPLPKAIRRATFVTRLVNGLRDEDHR
jgi:hypothetical protein